MAKSTTEYVCNIPKVRIDRGDHHEEFVGGQVLKDVPASTLEGMIRVGSAVPAEDYLADEVEYSGEPEEEGSPESDESPAPAADWKQTPVVDLDLPEGVIADLVGAGLETVVTVLEFAAANNGLTSIDGIGDASEAKVQAAIQKVTPQE